jgi:hypothetical protein
MVVVPTGKMLPAGTPLRVMLTAPEQVLAAVAVPSVASLTKALHEVALAPVVAVTAGGARTVGDSLPVTVTLKVQVASGLMPFDAVQVTAVVPAGKTCGEVMTCAPI